MFVYMCVYSIEEVPSTIITPPSDINEEMEINALGKMLIKRSSRIDLIDGAYNRYAFNDDSLPDW